MGGGGDSQKDCGRLMWIGWWGDVRGMRENTDDTGSLEQTSGRKMLLIREKWESWGECEMYSEHKICAGVPRVALMGWGLGGS